MARFQCARGYTSAHLPNDASVGTWIVFPSTSRKHRIYCNRCISIDSNVVHSPHPLETANPSKLTKCKTNWTRGREIYCPCVYVQRCIGIVVNSHQDSSNCKVSEMALRFDHIFFLLRFRLRTNAEVKDEVQVNARQLCCALLASGFSDAHKKNLRRGKWSRSHVCLVTRCFKCHSFWNARRIDTLLFHQLNSKMNIPSLAGCHMRCADHYPPMKRIFFIFCAFAHTIYYRQLCLSFCLQAQLRCVVPRVLTQHSSFSHAQSRFKLFFSYFFIFVESEFSLYLSLSLALCLSHHFGSAARQSVSIVFILWKNMSSHRKCSRN